jgi:hypothetical protein
MIPLLTYRFNLMATNWKLKLNCKKLLLLRLIEEDFIEVKKNVYLHLINNLLSTAGWYKITNNWNDLPVLTKKILQQP